MQDRDQLDAIIQRMIAAGESDEDIGLVIQSMQAEASHKPAAPLHPHARVGKMVTNVLRRENWPMLAGGAGGLIGGIPGAALGGTMGKFAQMQAEGMDGKEPESVGGMLKDASVSGGVQGALEGGGRALAWGGGKVAHTLMNRALGPSKAANAKYGVGPEGDLAQQMLNRNRRVSVASADKEQAAREAAQGIKSVTNRRLHDMTTPTQPIRDAAARRTGDAAEGEALLAGRFTGRQPTRTITNFARRPEGASDVMSFPEIEKSLRVLNTKTDAARRQIAGPNARTPRLQDAENIALSKELRATQDAVSPVFQRTNSDIRAGFGRENAIRQRLQTPGSGLADETAIFGSMVDPRMAIGRIIREPQMLSTIALLVNQLSKTGKVAPNVARALLASSHDR